MIPAAALLPLGAEEVGETAEHWFLLLRTLKRKEDRQERWTLRCKTALRMKCAQKQPGVLPLRLSCIVRSACPGLLETQIQSGPKVIPPPSPHFSFSSIFIHLNHFWSSRKSPENRSCYIIRAKNKKEESAGYLAPSKNWSFKCLSILVRQTEKTRRSECLSEAPTNPNHCWAAGTATWQPERRRRRGNIIKNKQQPFIGNKCKVTVAAGLTVTDWVWYFCRSTEQIITLWAFDFLYMITCN